MTRGIIYVVSRLSLPTTTTTTATPLTPESFCTWYENQHIQEVTTLSGVTGAVRYESVPTHQSASAPHTPSWLTIYTMPDLEFQHSAEFKGLDGQSAPKGDLLERVFKQARFDTSFYAEIDTITAATSTSTPAGFLVSWSFTPRPDKEAEFGEWWAGEVARKLDGCEGVGRVRRFGVRGATSLDQFVRRVEDVPRMLVLCEVLGEDGVGVVEGVVEEGREWVEDGGEVGVWRVRRVYE